MKQQRIKANTVYQKYDKSILMKSICAIWECYRTQLIFHLILKYQHNFNQFRPAYWWWLICHLVDCSQSSMNGRIHPMDSPINNCQAQLTSVINPFNYWDWSARSNVHRRACQWRGYQLSRILIFWFSTSMLLRPLPFHITYPWLEYLHPPPHPTPKRRHIPRHRCCSCRHLTLNTPRDVSPN